MRRKILIAEQTDTLRSVAETVLRQNGYDVIAVTAAGKAGEVLALSRPDLIIVGADLGSPDGLPFHERLQQDAKLNDIPMLLFEPANKTDLGLPEEIMIPRPFEPQDLLQKVSIFLGGDKSGSRPGAAESAVNDDFLDAALGIENLDVTDSEVMDQTVVGKRPKAAAAPEKFIGLDSPTETDANDTGSTTVESLIIDEDSSRVKHRSPGRTAPSPDGTGKIEILADQFGMTETGKAAEDDDAAHDYDWFVDAMKSDADPAAPAKPPDPSDSGSLAIGDPSAAVDPVTPAPPSPPADTGVEKFIDEFKKEMEQARATEEVKGELPPVPESLKPVDDGMSWEEKLEQIGPAQIDLFIKEFARELGRKVAEMMATRIDSDKLHRLIKSEIMHQVKKSS